MMIRRLAFGTLLVALALLAVPAGSLAGPVNHPFLSAGNPEYEDACGLAVNSSGALFVSDYYRDAVDAPGGQIKNEDPSDGPCGLAVDASGNLYVNNWRANVVEYTASEFSGGPGSVIDPGPATGVAVDASGNVYVDRGTYIAEYQAPFTPGSEPAKKIGLGTLGEGYGVAVSIYPETLGDLYVPDAADNTVKVYNPLSSLTAPIAVIDGKATPQGGFTHLVDAEVAVDPKDGHVYVLDDIGYGHSDHPKGAFDEFNSAGAYRGQITGFLDAEPSGIAFANGDVFLTSGNSEGSQIFTYGPTAPGRTLTVTKTGTGGGTVSTPPAGIACGNDCTAEYSEEETVTLFAHADGHSELTGWTVAGPGTEPCPGATPSCTVLLLGNVEVHANFAPAPQQKLSVTLAGSGSGTITSEPAGISCSSGTCSEEFTEGRVVALLAAPAPHNKIVGWSGCESQPSPTECKVTLSEAMTVKAEFAPLPQKTISVSLTGTGTGEVTSYPWAISCPGTCSEHFDEGASINLVASADPDSEFAGWSGGGCSGTAVICTVKMSEAQSVGVSFEALAPPPSKETTTTTITTTTITKPPPPPAQLKLVKIAVKGTSATLELSVSVPGSVSAAGKDLQSASAKAPAAGALTLDLALSKAGKRALRKAKHRNRRLKLTVTLTFSPASGAHAVLATETVTFRATKKHRRR
ncbi:MAG TPA: hypothetical protein VND98_11940 [Solirubrobacterales bacterium]|nr:hypothetical protein [Solirubrobacterales bacterium]